MGQALSLTLHYTGTIAGSEPWLIYRERDMAERRLLAVNERATLRGLNARMIKVINEDERSCASEVVWISETARFPITRVSPVRHRSFVSMYDTSQAADRQPSGESHPILIDCIMRESLKALSIPHIISLDAVALCLLRHGGLKPLITIFLRTS
ncbi:hypothetical protein F5148DRAFT_838868 [Russula earlei]|uniref:Uncharacterized protein n=1 Tax=Russula earlei TaxID=71964 RepID=A0ACC0UDB8_9AGAM|nr:hypothetical protein F5148DRAFT_838868 [Russula earlei]